MVNSNRVLIVDDDENIRSVLCRFFDSHNWISQAAVDGDDALVSLKGFTPDIILMDIKMPVRDGIVTCRLIKADKKIVENYPIIMMTGYHDPALIKQSLSAGCDDYIFKPFDFKSLLEKVNRLVSHYRSIRTEHEAGYIESVQTS